MNRDLHVIKEEDECPNHLLNSVVKIIKCAGEANVDKICRKLRNNSNIQYSKFQIEKAMDTAVQKGIFDVKNDLYKLKDSYEDRDYRARKVEKELALSPNREESGKESDSASESELHVEFKTCTESHNSEAERCPHCGVVKKDSEKASKTKFKSKRIKEKSKEESELKCKKKSSDNQDKGLRKKKKHYENHHLSKSETENNSAPSDKDSNGLNSLNSSYSNIDFLEAFEEESTKRGKRKLKRKHKKPKKSPSPENENERWSPFKTDSESEENQNIQELPKKKKAWSSINKMKKTKVSENDNPKVRKRSTSIFVEDWFEQSNEPQGAIMQSNNLLQIEPMDLLVVKNPQPASYFM